MNQTSRILEEVKKAVCGKDRVLVWVLTVLLARGHVLLEDIPGVGKTTWRWRFPARWGSITGACSLRRTCCRPISPAIPFIRRRAASSLYQPGAVLCNLFLADELNRATSRTQSALLEAMEEGQVTVDGVAIRPGSRLSSLPRKTDGSRRYAAAAGLTDGPLYGPAVPSAIRSPADECSMVLARQGVNPLQTVEQVLSRQELVASRTKPPRFTSKKSW